MLYQAATADKPTKLLVPTARLELAQLSPLPPQDSVSTNFTTSAKRNGCAFQCPGLHEDSLTGQPLILTAKRVLVPCHGALHQSLPDRPVA